jgi:hypothetical protein
VGEISHSGNIIPYPGLLFDILTLARENNIMSVLPCAYYHVVAECTQIRSIRFPHVPGFIERI